MTTPRRFALSLALFFAVTAPGSASGQSASPSRAADTQAPVVPRELRAVWVATVENMDWPSRKGLSTAQQQAELIAILDRVAALHMNAVILQVRPAADALYQSSIEPWSDFITGQMGRAPEPFYDPLAFAVAEAHKRGLELHAWINPYRAKVPATRSVSSGHISRTRPDLVRSYGPYLWMDPGDPEVRQLTSRVALDIVRRYDVDGLHMDDYFYPYKERKNGRELDFPDDVTYARYRRGGGALGRDDWRRENVNLLVRELNDEVHRVKPWVRFGISPFGIWRPGNPAPVRGLDQFAELYADARKWLNEGWVDYFTPQLYWPVNRPQQPYDQLLRWWAGENTHGRNLWPGNYSSKVGFTNSQRFSVDEVLEQIRLTRAQPGASGNVHFSMEVFMKNPAGLNERLVREAYPTPALVPASAWLDRRLPASPILSFHTEPASGSVMMDLRSATSTVASRPWLWVVQTRSVTGWDIAIIPAATNSIRIGQRGAALPEVRVTAVDRVGNAGPAVQVSPRS